MWEAELMSKFKWKLILNQHRFRVKEGTRPNFDERTNFDNDYERIIFSPSFRRLQDKAQLFPLEKFDFSRTRLTHSYEVATIAKTLGCSIGKKLMELTKNDEEKLDINDVNDICTILTCAGLVHDLGNPPFGHFGETAIREWFKDKLTQNEDKSFRFRFGKHEFDLREQETLDLINFEGNAQALRILTKLHFIMDENGMNLTNGVLNSIIKYPVSSLEIDEAKVYSKKNGYFAAENDVFKTIVSSTGLFNKRNPLVYILEAADDIAYLLGDLEDAFKKNIITYDMLLNEYDKFISSNSYAIGSKEEKSLYFLKRNFDKAKDELKYEDPGEYALKLFRISLLNLMRESAAKEFIDNYYTIMSGEYEGELLSNIKISPLTSFLRGLAKKHIYNNKYIISSEIVGYNMISKMLDTFVPIVLKQGLTAFKGYEGKVYSLISKNYRFVCENYELNKTCTSEYYRLLLVTDFICGMTDSYAAYIYQTLKGIEI
jgi:dGTPase